MPEKMTEAQIKVTPGAVTPQNETPKLVSWDKERSNSERQTPAVASTSKTGKAPAKTVNKPSKPDAMTPTQLNKEVFSVLKELNDSYKQQNTGIEQQNSRIDKLSRKLDTMYEYDDCQKL